MVSIGFNFTFYNVDYLYAVVSTNGNMQFSTAATDYSFSIPSSTVNPVISWLATYAYAEPSYYYTTTGSVGSKQFLLRVPSSGAYLEVSPYGSSVE